MVYSLTLSFTSSIAKNEKTLHFTNILPPVEENSMVREISYTRPFWNFVNNNSPSVDPLRDIIRHVAERHGFVFGENEYYPERVEDLSDPRASPLTTHVLSAYGRWTPRIHLFRRQVVYVPEIFIPGRNLNSELSQQLAVEIARAFKARRPSNVVVKLPPIVVTITDQQHWARGNILVAHVSFPNDGEKPTTRFQMIREEFSHRIKRG